MAVRLVALLAALVPVCARTYAIRRLDKYPAACPYSACWLVRTDFFLAVRFPVKEKKLERASFYMFYKASPAFQLGDKVAYYVNHLSEFEHKYTRRRGSREARRATRVLSRSAFRGECANMTARDNAYVAVIPFIGFKSVGHSTADAHTKLLQLGATLCSCARWFGHAVVGVSREADLRSVRALLQLSLPALRDRVHLVQFNVSAPSSLPYNALTWTQQLVISTNCEGSFARHERLCAESETGAYAHTRQQLLVVAHDAARAPLPHIEFVFFNEADQLVRFDSEETFEAVSAVSNASSFVSARRREKSSFSPAESYESGLGHGRDCGVGGYELRWPASHLVTAVDSGGE